MSSSGFKRKRSDTTAGTITCVKCSGAIHQVAISHSEKNPNRPYYKCAGCNFSHWAPPGTPEGPVAAPTVPSTPKRVETLTCHKCSGSIFNVAISHSENNPNRPYYKCAKCNFSHWAPPGTPAGFIVNASTPSAEGDATVPGETAPIPPPPRFDDGGAAHSQSPLPASQRSATAAGAIHCVKCNGEIHQVAISHSEKNPNRPFYKCAGCCFSHWAPPGTPEGPMVSVGGAASTQQTPRTVAPSLHNNTPHGSSGAMPIPRCPRCHAQCVKLTSSGSSKRPHHEFYKCPNSGGDNDHFTASFAWVDYYEDIKQLQRTHPRCTRCRSCRSTFPLSMLMHQGEYNALCPDCAGGSFAMGGGGMGDFLRALGGLG